MECFTYLLIILVFKDSGVGAWHYQERVGAERILYDDLSRDHDPDVRPVLNASQTLSVSFSVALHQIMDLDVKNQTLLTYTWISEWENELIGWNPQDYDGLELIVVPSWMIWVPDLYIFNNADDGNNGFVQNNDSRATVYHTGRVRWVVPLMIQSSCAIDIKFFPFDNQKCGVVLGSWIYDGTQLNLHKKQEAVDMSEYIPNNEFHIIDISLEENRKVYDKSPVAYPQITLHLHFVRKPLYYAYTVLAPVLVLCFLMLFSYLLPCDDGNKVGIGLTVFLSLYVLQLAIAENMPEADSIPLIGIFLTLVLTLNSISLIFSTLVINIKKKGDRETCPKVPNFLMNLCKNVLAKLTCTTMVTYYDVYQKCAILEGSTVDPWLSYRQVEALKSHRPPLEEDINGDGDCYDSVSTCGLLTKNTHQDQTSEFGSLSRIRIGRNPGETLTEREKHQRDLRLEWYFVASTIDKTLFFLFLTAMFVTVLHTLVIMPYMNSTS